MGKSKKWIKWGAIITGILLLIVVIGYFIVNDPRPNGEEGPRAEEMAQKMLTSINHKAWLNTGAVRWNFDGRRELVWDRNRHYVKVSWENYEVYLMIDEMKGAVYLDGKKLDEEEANEWLQKAWEIWVNDSFWLNPVSKIYDQGTSRSLVDLPDGGSGLLVEFSSGGATPGDAYLWELDNKGLPVNWQMWVSIIPVGGLNASWEAWITTTTGVKISTLHKIGKKELRIHDVETASDLIELMGEDIFEGEF